MSKPLLDPIPLKIQFPSSCFGLRGPTSRRLTTPSFKLTRQIAPTESLLVDSERPEVWLFAS